MKIELKNGETFDSIKEFNYSINYCISCEYFNNCKNIECSEKDNISYYQFVGIKSIEMKVKTDE